MDTGQFFNRNALKFFGLGLVIAVIGMAVASAGYAFSNSPALCSSCHSMERAHATWQASNHKQFACVECHLPNGNAAETFVAKAQTGIVDAYHEVMRDYPEKPKVTAQGKQYLLENCMRCHQSTIENTTMAAGGNDCVKCHRDLVHARNIGKGIGGMKLE